MRLAVAILWSLATLMWLPWFAVLVRFIVDLASGTPFAVSEYLNPALIGIWPVRGWASWGIVSWVPILGASSMLMTYIGWRFFWWWDDWKVSYPTLPVVLSVLIPPLALILLYRDARRRFAQRNAELQQAVDDARESLSDGELRLLS
jgi:hypothetical protein